MAGLKRIATSLPMEDPLRDLVVTNFSNLGLLRRSEESGRSIACAHLQSIFGCQDVSGVAPRTAAHFMYADGCPGPDGLTCDLTKCVCHLSDDLGFLLRRKYTF